MLPTLSQSIRASTIVLRAASAWGLPAERTWEWSSRKVTSRQKSQTVFDGPVVPQEGGNGFWTGLGRRQIGEARDDLLARFFHKDHLLGLLAFLAGFGLWAAFGWSLREALRFLLVGWGLFLSFSLLDHSAALALDGSHDLKALSNTGPLVGKPVIHLGAGAHRARSEASMAFVGL